MAEQAFVYVCKTCAYDVMSEHELSEMGSDPCADCKRDNSSFKEKSPSVQKHQTDSRGNHSMSVYHNYRK